MEGDALALPFDDARFDAVTMDFGILHVPEPERAMAQARRVIAPGGRYAFTAWVIEGHEADAIVDAAMADHAEPVELPRGPDPYRFADADLARAALAAAGVIVSGAIRAQTPERQAAIRDAMAEGVRVHPDGDGFTEQIAARVVSAATPS